MLDVDTTFLIQFTDTTLHKCAVCSATLRGNVDGLLTAELWDKDDDIEPGQEFLAYYDIDGKYVKHSARIEMVLPSDARSMIAFRLIDQPISAENREDERITIQDMGLIANFDNETDYPLIDVSNLFYIGKEDEWEKPDSRMIDRSLVYRNTMSPQNS